MVTKPTLQNCLGFPAPRCKVAIPVTNGGEPKLLGQQSAGCRAVHPESWNIWCFFPSSGWISCRFQSLSQLLCSDAVLCRMSVCADMTFLPLNLAVCSFVLQIHAAWELSGHVVLPGSPCVEWEQGTVARSQEGWLQGQSSKSAGMDRLGLSVM